MTILSFLPVPSASATPLIARNPCTTRDPLNGQEHPKVRNAFQEGEKATGATKPSAGARPPQPFCSSTWPWPERGGRLAFPLFVVVALAPTFIVLGCAAMVSLGIAVVPAFVTGISALVLTQGLAAVVARLERWESRAARAPSPWIPSAVDATWGST